MVRAIDALQDAASELFGIDRYAGVYSPIQLKRELSSKAELMQLAQDQLKSTMEGLHFLDNLKYRFPSKLGRDLVLHFLAVGTTTNGAEVLKDFEFKAMGDRAAIRLTLEDSKKTLSKLRRWRDKLDNKLGKIKKWRKRWNIFHWILKFGFIGLAVFLTVLTAPPAAFSVANIASAVMGLLKEWVDSKWDKYQRSCEAERELTGKFFNEAFLTFHGFKQVGVLYERLLEAQFSSLTHHHAADQFAIGEDEDPEARMVLERMKRKAADVTASVLESLEKEVDRHREELRRSALTILLSVTDQQVGNFYNIGKSDIPVGYDENY